MTRPSCASGSGGGETPDVLNQHGPLARSARVRKFLAAQPRAGRKVGRPNFEKGALHHRHHNPPRGVAKVPEQGGTSRVRA